MRIVKTATILSIGLTVVAGTVMLAARGQSRPGEMTQAHVWIDNRSPNEAIPVVVQRNAEALQVQVTGTHRVTLDPATVVGTRVVRQPWEYRAITVGPGQDPAAALAAAGVEGWEAVGFLPADPGSPSGSRTFLLKRPR